MASRRELEKSHSGFWASAVWLHVTGLSVEVTFWVHTARSAMTGIVLIGLHRTDRRDTRRSDRSAVLRESVFVNASFCAINAKFAVVARRSKFDSNSVHRLVSESGRPHSEP